MRSIFVVSHQRRKFLALNFFPNYGILIIVHLLCMCAFLECFMHIAAYIVRYTMITLCILHGNLHNLVHMQLNIFICLVTMHG